MTRKWTVLDYDNVISVLAAKRASHTYIEVVVDDGSDLRALARLIAAAPDLLECLRMFVKADDMTGWDYGVWQHHAETVIATAEGRNP
jgi:hypothetical protein